MCVRGPEGGDHRETRRSPEGTVPSGPGVRPQVPGVLHEGPVEPGGRWLGTQPEELGHRLNNPLAVIVMNLSWIKKNVPPEDEEMAVVLAETSNAAEKLRNEIQEEINVRCRQVGRTGQRGE